MLIAILLGVSAGVFTGLTPGIHINMVAAAAYSIMPYLPFSPFFLATALVAMSITHTFFDFIPSILLGAPDPDTALAALPGHQMLMKGQGYAAIHLTIIGSFACLMAVVLVSPLLVLAVPLIYSFLYPFIGLILAAFVALLILKEEGIKKKAIASVVSLLSGILGLVVLNSPINQPLFPMLTGLFGMSMLATSIKSKAFIPKQRIEDLFISKKALAKPVLLGVLSGGLVSIFPGLGPAQAAALVSLKKMKTHTYLMVIGGINTVSMFFALITMYTIGKARNGSIVVVQELLETVYLSDVMVLVAVSVVTGIIAFFLSLKISKLVSSRISSVNYPKLSLAVMALIIALVLLISGISGLAVLAAATLIGIIPIKKGIHRSHLMSCLLLPVMKYFFYTLFILVTNSPEI